MRKKPKLSSVAGLKIGTLAVAVAAKESVPERHARICWLGRSFAAALQSASSMIGFGEQFADLLFQAIQLDLAFKTLPDNPLSIDQVSHRKAENTAI